MPTQINNTEPISILIVEGEGVSAEINITTIVTRLTDHLGQHERATGILKNCLLRKLSYPDQLEQVSSVDRWEYTCPQAMPSILPYLSLVT